MKKKKKKTNVFKLVHLIKHFHLSPSPRQKPNSLMHHFAQDLRLEVSVYSVYIKHQFQTTFVHGWGGGGGKIKSVSRGDCE